jgi:hypothetical protein
VKGSGPLDYLCAHAAQPTQYMLIARRGGHKLISDVRLERHDSPRAEVYMSVRDGVLHCSAGSYKILEVRLCNDYWLDSASHLRALDLVVAPMICADAGHAWPCLAMMMLAMPGHACPCTK